MLLTAVVYASPAGIDFSFSSIFEESATIVDIELQPNGKILAGGTFRVRNSSRRDLVRLNSDGSLDASFNPPNAFFNVRSLLLLPDGRVYVGGSSNQSGGDPIIRLNADGTLDSTFDFTCTISPCPVTIVDKIAVQPDGKVLVYAGNISGGAGTFRLTAGGAQEQYLNFAVPFQSSTVQSIRVGSDGKIMIAGLFDYVIAGQTYNSLVRLNSDLTIDPSFRLKLQGVAVNGFNQFYVSDFKQFTDGRILIWGSFLTVNGWNKRNIAFLNSDGSTIGGFFFVTPPAAGIKDVVVQQDGKFVVHSDPEDSFFCCSTRSSIFRLNTEGRADGTFRPIREPKGSVETMEIGPDNKLTAAGGFWRFDGTPRTAIIRLRL